MTRLLGFVLGALALAAGAFVLGTQLATRNAISAGERVRAALAEPDPIARTLALVPALLDVESGQLLEVEEAYRDTFAGGGPGDAAIVLLCETWAAFDPVAGLDRISHWPEPERGLAGEALLRVWARRNAVAALQWTEGIRDDGTATEAALAGWAESGDPRMWDYVAKMRPGIPQQSALYEMMKWSVAREGVDGLFERVVTLPDDGPADFKRTAIGTATALVATHDPERALAFADRQADGPYGAGLLSRVAVRWVVSDGPAAMQNLLDRSPSAERDWALRETYRKWLRRDRAAALAWMPESAPGDARFTPLADVYAVALAYDDPEDPGSSARRAIGWAEQIPDAAKRHETLVKLGVIWLYFEPDAAAGWLAGNGLDAEVRAEAARYRELKERFSGSL